MKWNQIIFNVNFDDCLQNGINNFMHESGYTIREMPTLNQPHRTMRKQIASLLILVLQQIAIIATGLLIGFAFL